jgi:hypothetical protein
MGCSKNVLADAHALDQEQPNIAFQKTGVASNAEVD